MMARAYDVPFIGYYRVHQITFFWKILKKKTTEYFLKFLFLFESTIHTYIIGHYNPSVRIIDLVSYTTYVVCVNFIHKWRNLHSLKSTPNYRFFEKLFIAILFTLRVFARNLVKGNRRRNTFRISF